METVALNPEEAIEWPSDATAAQALQKFADAVRGHYGSRVKGLYLFGSRARGEHRPDSDADVAVMLADGDWIEWKERWALYDLAFGPRLETGLAIQPWPFSESEWGTSAASPRTGLVTAARRDVVSLVTS